MLFRTQLLFPPLPLPRRPLLHLLLVLLRLQQLLPVMVSYARGVVMDI